MKNITLELSLKPFKQTDDAYIESVCRRLFTQWAPLVRETPQISVLLWCADGSEILDYRGSLDDEMEWCRYMGGANPRETWNRRLDPERRGLHSRSYLYTENPPVITYGTLARIVSALKRIGGEVLPGKTIRVGETFDPGPEFARSSFKYERHNEICTSSTMGVSSFVCAYAKLHADSVSYAGFPDGIPEGTPFGTFLGRQCACFLPDMGFDYFWLSNGVGFGRDTWSTTGALFDGTKFDGSAIPEIREDVLSFWRYFRAECPDIPVETRGTNMSMGIDMATDGVPLGALYDGDFGILPPPNSPWAAIDGDYSLELMGHLSRIAKVPGDTDYLFRFYVHDPWWVNSPWYDRYNGLPHDIYLPLALSRIDKEGRTCPPTHLALLSADNTFGDLPDSCADEATPHLRKAIKESPDAPAPLVWVYPFEEYTSATTGAEAQRMFAGDWFVRDAIAEGLPLASVVASDHFLYHDPALYSASILLTPVPEADSALEKELLARAARGTKILFYGSARNAGESFRQFFQLHTDSEEVSGEFPLTVNGASAGVLKTDPLLSDGGLTEWADSGIFACAQTEKGPRALAVQQKNAIWLRGTVSADFRPGAKRLIRHNPEKYFPGESLAVLAFERLGWQMRYDRPIGQPAPIVTLHRHNGALIFAAHHPSTTVTTRLKFPLGAPILDAYEAVLEDGYAVYHFPKAERKECRVFVEQNSGVVGVREIPPVSADYRRRIAVHGLQNATVRVFAENYCRESIGAVLNSQTDLYFVGDEFEGEYKTDEYGTYYEAKNITGTFVFSMPYKNGSYT